MTTLLTLPAILLLQFRIKTLANLFGKDEIEEAIF